MSLSTMEKPISVVLLLIFIFFNYITARVPVDYYKKNINKIVGGYNITIQDAPYQVYLLLQMGNDDYQCGGSIISERYVLTAAHCLAGIQRVFVRAGSTYADYGGIQYNSTRFRSHPLYNPATFDYDVGVINIPGGIALDGYSTRAISLPARGTVIPNDTNIFISGWGDTTEGGQVSENLMAVQIPTVPQEECRETYTTLTSRQFCAGLEEGGKDSCQGDSGGPAVSTDTGLQIGIVSYGYGCARPDTPGVYTNVARVRRWIRLATGV